MQIDPHNSSSHTKPHPIIVNCNPGYQGDGRECQGKIFLSLKCDQNISNHHITEPGTFYNCSLVSEHCIRDTFGSFNTAPSKFIINETSR